MTDGDDFGLKLQKIRLLEGLSLEFSNLNDNKNQTD